MDASSASASPAPRGANRPVSRNKNRLPSVDPSNPHKFNPVSSKASVATSAGLEPDDRRDVMQYVEEQVIVICPGSSFIKYGRACDETPRLLPAVLATRRKNLSGTKRKPDLVPHDAAAVKRRAQALASKHSQLLREQDEEYARLRARLAREYKKREEEENTFWERKEVPVYTKDNSNVPVLRPATLPESLAKQNFQWTNVHLKPNVVVGDAALRIHPSEPYDVIHPFRSGGWNMPLGVSMAAAADRFEHLLRYILFDILRIPKQFIENYVVALVVPETWSKREIMESYSLLLTGLGLGAVVVHQESVLAAFGAGLSSACVVNMGAQCTNIACVMDGMMEPCSRISLPYGGDTLSQVLHYVVSHPHKDFFFPDLDTPPLSYHHSHYPHQSSSQQPQPPPQQQHGYPPMSFQHPLYHTQPYHHHPSPPPPPQHQQHVMPHQGVARPQPMQRSQSSASDENSSTATTPSQPNNIQSEESQQATAPPQTQSPPTPDADADDTPERSDEHQSSEFDLFPFPPQMWTVLENMKRQLSYPHKDNKAVRTSSGELARSVYEFLWRMHDGRLEQFRVTCSMAWFLTPMALFHPALLRPFVHPPAALSLTSYLTRPALARAYDTRGAMFLEEEFLLNPNGFVISTKDPSKGPVVHEPIAGPSSVQHGRLLSVAEAVFASLQSLPTQDCAKLKSRVLLTGGSAAIPGFMEALESKLREMFTRAAPAHSEVPDVEVLLMGKPQLLSWTGMAVVAPTEGCKDMWISRREWQDCDGFRLFRERLAFDIDNCTAYRPEEEDEAGARDEDGDEEMDDAPDSDGGVAGDGKPADGEADADDPPPAWPSHMQPVLV